MTNGNGNGSEELTGKQEEWCKNYLKCFNATEAGRGVYKGDDNTLAQTGWQNLRKPKIKARIDRALAASTMSPEEILMRLSEQARGDLADLRGVETIDDLRDNPKSHLVKQIKVTRTGRNVTHTTIKIYDAQAALEKLARCHAMFSEKIEIEPSEKFQELLKDLKNDNESTPNG